MHIKEGILQNDTLGNFLHVKVVFLATTVEEGKLSDSSFHQAVE
ncbi:MAG: hypothetical protein ACFFE2_03775 [Candidatus Thorarchaeota archaeon]